ncbi:WD40 repeat domain-containing protein [Streptomyces sp. TRM76323]|uniref:WD40 repeat domain-containing protein n=1 Tax=Streptomyces tamarix TaxID=3078565 RepID=A0ABU3QP01_9ACTN|nr:WD40 repeat domain-containing protein [Streptomyces tamarix]MDT9684473.1 WD40 repeat domain-containing protein [Streptomyces tamarix]
MLSAGQPVQSVAHSPHGRPLTAGSREERTIALWDISDPAEPVRRADIPAQAKGGLFDTGSLWLAGPHTVVAVENERHLRLWDVSDPDRPRMGDVIEEAALRQDAVYDGVSKLLTTEESGGTIRLYDLSRPARPVKGKRIPAAPGSYFPAGKDELATAVAEGTIESWDVSDPGKPRKKERGTVHLDRAITSVDITADGRHARPCRRSRSFPVRQRGREGASTMSLPSGAVGVQRVRIDRSARPCEHRTTRLDTSRLPVGPRADGVRAAAARAPRWSSPGVARSRPGPAGPGLGEPGSRTPGRTERGAAPSDAARRLGT